MFNLKTKPADHDLPNLILDGITHDGRPVSVCYFGGPELIEDRWIGHFCIYQDTARGPRALLYSVLVLPSLACELIGANQVALVGNSAAEAEAAAMVETFETQRISAQYTTAATIPALPDDLDLPYNAKVEITGTDGWSCVVKASFMHRPDGIELLVWKDPSRAEEPPYAAGAIANSETELTRKIGRQLRARALTPHRTTEQTARESVWLWR